MSSLVFPQDSASKPAGVSGGKRATPNSSILRKTPGLKAKVGPSVSCLRRNSDSRNLASDRAVSPQRIRRVSSSGKSQIIQLCFRAAHKLFKFKLVPSGSTETGFGSRTLVHCVTKPFSLLHREGRKRSPRHSYGPWATLKASWGERYVQTDIKAVQKQACLHKQAGPGHTGIISLSDVLQIAKCLIILVWYTPFIMCPHQKWRD